MGATAQSGDRLGFDDQHPGVCSFTVTGTMGNGSLDADLEWTLDGITGSTLTSNPNPAKGPSVTFTFTNLPNSNDAFGSKTLTLSHPQVAGSTARTLEIYYSFAATNNPGNTYPNWFYYYDQTSATQHCHYDHNGSRCNPLDWPNFTPYVGALHNPHTVNIYTDPRSGISIKYSGRTLWGIDVFAYASNHEYKHHCDYSLWWGAQGLDPSNDQDQPWGDNVPDDREPNFLPPDGGPYYTTTCFTHPESAIGGFDDQAECEFTQQECLPQFMIDKDWAYPGSRWH